MRPIDLGFRHEPFEMFRRFDSPHFNVTAAVEVGGLREAARRHGTTMTIVITYLLARTANEVVNFRWRIHGDQVVEHEVVHPAITVLGADDVFGFCHIEYFPLFSRFAVEAADRIGATRERPSLDNPDRDDLLYMTAIPWVSFTSFMHPMTHPVDSIPRIAWGKVFPDRQEMPLSVQGHHALMDGLHVGRFFERMQQHCDSVDDLLNS